ncbi:uncharacterized protein G2W53_016960 [Senna tora]|uniref:Uncharacterized protein n=1 Tax=Senna tora TaxID=362788 RepID=A0A834TRW8_9FABA|nr:uncharacterized protein G2W53_016960 [Senna tora]
MGMETMRIHFVKPIVFSPLSFLKSHIALQEGPPRYLMYDGLSRFGGGHSRVM